LKRKNLDTLIAPVLAASVLLADRASKHLVARRLVEGQSWDIAPWLSPIFRITYATNTGAAFGLFPQRNNLFIAVAVIVVVAIIIYHRHLPDGQWAMRLALGLQLGGAIGNLVDRVRVGSVVDFIDLNFWPLRRWPVSNLADISIVTGVTLLALLMLREEWLERNKQQATADGC
jgi:signal peptidase II